MLLLCFGSWGVLKSQTVLCCIRIYFEMGNGLKCIKQILTWEMCFKKDLVLFMEMFVILSQIH